MSEIIDNKDKKKALLKELILKLHNGEAPQQVKTQLVRLMGKIPYGVVVEAEQELISEGLPEQEVLKLCDIHGEALKGVIDTDSAPEAPPGHPAHTFLQENQALKQELSSLEDLFKNAEQSDDLSEIYELIGKVRVHFNALMDVDKHYRRKENLLFPFLEKHGITGPSMVMWGKHDEARELLNAAIEALPEADRLSKDEIHTMTDLVLKPAAGAVDEMIYKEKEILLPMCMDTLTEIEWYEIYQQSSEIGFCLYDPGDEWTPAGASTLRKTEESKDRIQLYTGSFSLEELSAVFDTLPADVTFVDKDDTVKYFTHGKDRIFDRSRAILGRKVQQCHPPASVHVIQQILDDFRSGRQDRAAFWINFNERFVHIEYFAVHDDNSEYLGTLEVTQDLTEKRKLEGEQRLLSYEDRKEKK